MNDTIIQSPETGRIGLPVGRTGRGFSAETSRLAAVMRVSPVGIGSLSDNIIIEANPQLCELTGLSHDELIGFPFSQLFARTDELRRVEESLRIQLAERSVARAETHWRRPDGKVINVSLTVTVFEADRATRRWTFTVEDLTARHEHVAELALCQKQLAGFHTISELMQNDEPGTETFDAIACLVSEMTGFPIVAIELCDFSRAVMIYCGSHGVKLEGLPGPMEVPMDVTPSGQVAMTGEALVETEAAIRRDCAAPFFRQFAAETFVCVPIKTGQQVIGALSLAHRRREPVSLRVLLQIESLANYLATLFSRLRAHEAVRKGEAELAAVYDHAPSVMCLLDEKLQIVRANRAAQNFLRGGDEEPAVLSPGAFLNCEGQARKPDAQCVPAQACLFCALRRAVGETLETGQGWHQTRVRKRPASGTGDLTVLISTARLRVAGSTRVLLCLEDITRNERAAEQIRSQAALLDVARDAIIVRDFADKISYWNEGARQMYGWSAAEAVGRTVSELLLGGNVRSAVEAFRTVQDHDDWTGEMRHLTRDGRKLTVQSRWTLVRDRSGAPQGILIVNSDLTEKSRLEAQLLRAQRLESIGALASGLAHDLNNVLAPIMMSVHMLREEAADESARACLDTLETCAQRGADIVSQVLTFARGVEGARVPLHPKHLLADIQRIVRETFPRSIRLESKVAKETALVECDATQMQQVLLNLCVNARDAMPEGGTLTLRLANQSLGTEAAGLHSKAKPGDYVVLSVTDTGMGMTPEIREKIFDPFFSTKPAGHGTGLGLSIVQGIAESHGGFVQVESEVGQGTTFQVYLPAAVTEYETIVGRNGGADLPQGNGETVLVVDDEPAIRRIVEVILSRNGYETLLAADGCEAMSLFRQHRDRISVLVSDLMMPNQDGSATIRAIRQLKDSVRVIAITGLGEEARMVEAKAAGAEAFLKKPFTTAQLLTAVKELVQPRPA